MHPHKGSAFRVLATLVASAVPAAASGACGRSGAGSPGDAGNVDESDAPSADASSGSSSGGGGPDGDDSSNADASSSGSGSGSGSNPCNSITSMTYPVDAAACEPQLQEESWINDAGCQWHIVVPCAAETGPSDGAAGDGSADAADPCAICALYTDSVGNACSMGTNDAGMETVLCGHCCGRAPRGFVPRESSRSVGATGAHLARMAQIEAASVDAFFALHADLARAGAPRRLLARVRVAARDEVRHARDVGRAARGFGASVPRARVRPIGSRSLEQLATENAEQGCVEETLGAAIAAAQARHAKVPMIRRLMRTIAREELRHAALAWDIAAWLERKLDAGARDRVRQARLAALRKLEEGVAAGAAGDDAIGLPDATAMLAMLRRMGPALASGELAA